MGGWGHGMNMWGGGGFHPWMCVWWFFVAAGIALLVYLAVRAFSSKSSAPAVATGAAPAAAPSSGVQASSARLILEERLARGEISADEFRELIKVLEA